MVAQDVRSLQTSGNIRFLWLELTNLCNLQCVHCYAESSPIRSNDDLLSPQDYHNILSEAAELGCTQVQFIGGEPTLNKHLPKFIAHARALGYEFVEVFTNLTHLPSKLLNCFIEYNVHVATSVYSHLPSVHDQITQKSGSFRQTMQNIDTVLSAGLPLRAGVIIMPINEDHVDATIAFLRAKGVEDVNVDRVRDFGRASTEASSPSLENLCGKCADSTLCVAPDGAVSPCIMSKAWSVGSILHTPLAEVVQSSRLRDLRQQIHTHVVAPRTRSQPQSNINYELNSSSEYYPIGAPATMACVPEIMPPCGPQVLPKPPCVPQLAPQPCVPQLVRGRFA